MEKLLIYGCDKRMESKILCLILLPNMSHEKQSILQTVSTNDNKMTKNIDKLANQINNKQSPNLTK